MEPLKATQKKSKNPIPVIGMESKPSSGDRDALVAERAYYKAEARGYEPGHEIQDWLEAEAEVDEGVGKGK